MPPSGAAHETYRVSRCIAAPRAAVYRACLDPIALAAWRAPDQMTGRMHVFDARVGGGYRMSLTYQDAAGAPGKTTDDTDSFEARFAELIPDRRIVERVTFQSPDPDFSGEMTMITTLEDAGAGTEITLTFENLPAGIRPQDNAEGSRQALAKLAALLET
jgi:uncharacterized protein YndB with AHSA1/START domain